MNRAKIEQIIELMTADELLLTFNTLMHQLPPSAVNDAVDNWKSAMQAYWAAYKTEKDETT